MYVEQCCIKINMYSYANEKQVSLMTLFVDSIRHVYDSLFISFKDKIVK